MHADLLLIDNFLECAEREEILAELRGVGGAPATVHSGAPAGRVAPTVRKATRLAPSAAMRGLLIGKLRLAMPTVAQRFGALLTQCEEPQFLRYEVGGHFVAHQDGNTPLVHDDSRHRRVSMVIVLNAQAEAPAADADTFGGGALVMHGRFPDIAARTPVPAAPGTLVAFRSETTHEVMPVTHGERYSIVSWYR